MMSEIEKNEWNLPVLIGAVVATVIIALSWFVPGPWREAWDAVDAFIFFALNGMLADNRPMAVFWALANNRAFDLVPALIFLALFWRYMAAGGPEERVLERVAGCGLFVVYVVVVTRILDQLVLNVARMSPSLVMEPVHRLSEMVPWMRTKDYSLHSFPGDHGTVSIMFSICLVHCFGKRAGLWGLGLILLSIMPRTVAGAHWLTDVVVGSLMITLLPLALVFATPLHGILTGAIAAGARRVLPWADPFAKKFFSPATPPLVGKGMCMGTADIIPGVSGGTMAYILGIYQQLLESITVFSPEWFRNMARLRIRQSLAEIPFLFFVPLGFGIVLAMWIFTKMIPLPYFVDHHPEPVYGLFFGLVGGSVILLLRQHAGPRLMDGVTIAAGIALGITIVSLVPASTPDASWFIFLSGMLAISAMLLPGISGSFILLILGKYALILGAIGDLNLRVLLPFALGCGVGLLTFAHSLKWLMSRHTHTVNLIITGLLIGTLRAVWPFQERTYAEVNGKEKLITSEPFWPPIDAWISLAGVMLLLGFVAIRVLDRISRGHRK